MLLSVSRLWPHLHPHMTEIHSQCDQDLYLTVNASRCDGVQQVKLKDRLNCIKTSSSKGEKSPDPSPLHWVQIIINQLQQVIWKIPSYHIFVARHQSSLKSIYIWLHTQFSAAFLWFHQNKPALHLHFTLKSHWNGKLFFRTSTFISSKFLLYFHSYTYM